jgi:hypothetical protein
VDAIRSATNASDASDGAHPDATAVATQAPADADVEKSADRAPAVREQAAARPYSLRAPQASVAGPCTPDAAQSGARSSVELALPVSGVQMPRAAQLPQGLYWQAAREEQPAHSDA